MPAPRKNALQTLRHRNFRMLWIADSIAILGSQIQNVAIIWNVFALTEDPFQLGLLGLFRFVPVLFSDFTAVSSPIDGTGDQSWSSPTSC